MDFFVPKNVKARFEFFAGFGMKELFIFLLFTGSGLAFSYLLYLVTGKLAVFLIAVASGAFAFFVVQRDPKTGKSALDLLQDVKDYKLSQRRYYYRFGDTRKKRIKQ